MPALAIAQAAQSILQDALTAASVDATVSLGVPQSFENPPGRLWVYMFHDGSQDTEKAGPTVIQRTHTLPVRLLRLMDDKDAAAAETDILTLHDIFSNAFIEHRTLSGTCNTAIFGQRDQPRGASSPAYAAEGPTEFRQRWWTLTAWELLSFPFPTE